MRETRKRFEQVMNLDSLVDIVSNMVGILVILAAFMGLMTLLNPLHDPKAAKGEKVVKIPEKILVPWSHPTNKSHLFLALRGNRLQYFDLQPFFLELAKKNFTGSMDPVEIKTKGVDIRFFPVTNQVYCMEFITAPDFGENWVRAQREDSSWKEMLRKFPAEKFILFFWVDTNSFDLFRQVRKSLWDQNYEVGWKPAGVEDPLEICNGFEGSNTFRPQ